MIDNPEPRAQYLNVVLRQIERTSLRIPQFQRSFVWGERNVLDLLESIRKRYPIGSILTWKVERDSNYFAGFRTVPFPEPDPTLNAFEVVLDGAQRLSTLYGCLRAPEAGDVYRVFYDLREGTFVHRVDVKNVSPWHVPMDALFDSRKFLAIQSSLSELDDNDQLLRDALDLYSTFQDYQIPIIALTSDSLEDVVEVFRRVNSTGTDLSAVDFVRALTWRSSFDLEETFAEFNSRYENSPLEGMSDDFLTRCLAVAAGLSLDAREVIRLNRLAAREEALTSEIENMRAALDRMAAFLEGLHIREASEVPYEVQRLLLFAFMLFDANVDHAALEAWFWRSTFAEEHQGKPESYISRLVRELRAGNVEPALTVRKPVDPDLFAVRARRSGTAVAIGFELLLRKCHSRSLISGADASSLDSGHGLLFERRRLEYSLDTRLASTQLLANVAALAPEDVETWRTLRTDATALGDIYELCQERTGAAAEIWATQGFLLPVSNDAREVLLDRSRNLLSRVLPEVETSPSA